MIFELPLLPKEKQHVRPKQSYASHQCTLSRVVSTPTLHNRRSLYGDREKESHRDSFGNSSFNMEIVYSTTRVLEESNGFRFGISKK
jgi:hypothetical protein